MIPDIIRLINSVVKFGYTDPYGLKGSLDTIKEFHRIVRQLEYEVMVNDNVRLGMLEDTPKMLCYINDYMGELTCCKESFLQTLICRPVYAKADADTKEEIRKYYEDTHRALIVIVQSITEDVKRYSLSEIEDEINPQPTVKQSNTTVCRNTKILTPEPILTPELDTPEAHTIWNKAKESGWVNDDYSFNGTKYQMAYAAEKMGESLNLKTKWKPFEILWNYKYFPQTRRESKERFGKVEREKDLEKVFSL